MGSNLVNAIARYEGYGASTNNLPTKNNNPGNIVYGNFAASYGATKDPTSQFAIFPSSDTGFTAMTDLLGSSAYNNLSITDAIAKWNGQGSNSANYAATVASWTGLDPTTKVGDALAGSESSSVINNGSIDSSFLDSSFFNLFPTDDGSVVSTDSAIVSLPLLIGLGLAGLMLYKLIR